MNFLRTPASFRAAIAALALVALGLWSASSPLRASAEGDDLRAADAELNATYQTTLEAMPGNATRAKLREAQRAWIAFRDAEIELNGALPGASGNTLKMLQTELTETRTTKGFIMRYTPEGKGTVFVGKGLKLPTGLAFDSKGNLYVSNGGDGTIRKFSPGGQGKLYVDAQNQPAGLAVDPRDNLLKVDFKDNNLVRFSPPDGSGVVLSNDLRAPTSVLVIP